MNSNPEEAASNLHGSLHDRWALRRATLDAVSPLPADVVQRLENDAASWVQP
jgi:hypothetical protein